MMAALQHPRSGPERRLNGLRAPSRHRPLRPANRIAGRKLTSGFFRSVPPTRTWKLPSQVTNTHQESATYVFVFVPGCAVAPNNAAAAPTTQSHGITLVVGLTGQGGGFIPAGPNAQVTPVAFGVSFSWQNGIQFGYLPSAGAGLQVLPSYSGSVFLQVTDAGSLNTLQGQGYNVGGSGGEGVVIGGDVVTGWANGGPSPSTYVGLQVSFGGGGGFPAEGHAGTSYTSGVTTGGSSGAPPSYGGAGGSW